MSSNDVREKLAANAPEIPNDFQPGDPNRLFNWPWHYADEVLKARERNEKEKKSFWEEE